MNFAELLHELKVSEELLCSQDEWQNLEELVGDVRDKVDDIRFVRERLTFEAAWFESKIDDMKKRRATLLANKERLEEYVNWCLTQAELEECPGDKYRVKLQKNPISVKVARPPTVDDFAEYEDFVKRKVIFSWDLSALKKSALEENLPAKLTTAVQLEQGTHVRFYDRKNT